MFNYLKKIDDKLITYISQYDTYNTESKKKMYYEKILRKFKNNSRYTNYIAISSKFNNFYYPVYDIDDENKLLEYINIIKQLCDSFIVIRSSYNNYDNLNASHYWIITDEPSKNIKQILDNNIWKICNDSRYVDMCLFNNNLYIRGFYDSNSKRPSIYKKYGEFSLNFQLFIDKLFKYYDTYGFEISVLKSKSNDFIPEIIARERLKKIKKIEDGI